MYPLNPFLRAFFRSTVPGQCLPIHNHVLLVPTTESLIGSRDGDSNILYTDLVSSEDFLGSHVLRIPNTSNSTNKKDASNNVRDSRGKAKQVTTANGRTVIIKENNVYSNKGFKTLSQAQLLSDVLYYTPNNESQPWLIYYISRPLVGSFEPANVIPATLPGKVPPSLPAKGEDPKKQQPSSPQKKDVKTFGELLVHFPMIARQMQPGLERLFREFGKELGKPLPPPPSLSPSLSPSATLREDDFSVGSSISDPERLPFNSTEYFEDDEDLMRRSLETAVTAAIDLFRLVDKQQLSLLGATTDLTGPLVERLIERYVVEQVHGSLLFPRLCAFRRLDDVELDSRIRQMECIDVSQVGMVLDGGRREKQELLHRLSKGVDEFRKMTDANSPHDMLETLLATIKAVTVSESYDQEKAVNSEKQPSIVTVNADMLVSLLLIVVIRAQIRHLLARLLYMQHFIFSDDVESGEMGYALSTFEAVLTYLLRDSGRLRAASAKNKRLWNATKRGKMTEIKAILEPDGDNEVSEGESSHSEDEANPTGDGGRDPITLSLRFAPENSDSSKQEPSDKLMNGTSQGSPPLSHVFPFQTWTDDSLNRTPMRPTKKVSLDVSSMSGSSIRSQLSRTTTIASTFSGIEGDSSLETLTKTQNPSGDSIPMMAVESHQPETLEYLLSLKNYYPLDFILEDTNRDGATLLSAAVQHAQTQLVEVIINYLFNETDEASIVAYLSVSDVRGRTVAHYLFSAPCLMTKLGNLLPWRQKDKHGQTPLFALCRSYDHPDYHRMVNDALTAARLAQGDNQPLRLDDHADNKGNTLLHIVSDPEITGRILKECDCDPNATNDKRFTPLMTASKYGRVEQMRRLFWDSRVDVSIKESRGLTAVELAKDDEIRNRIDDLVLFFNPPSSAVDSTGRITTVVRSYFVEDATVRFVLKSGAPHTPQEHEDKSGTFTTYTVTTCRRTFADFVNLAKWLAIEHPASYMPTLDDSRTPFQIHSKPSRAVLHDMQKSLDEFLRILLSHPTFATHEMLWEFFLVPEMQPEMMADRSRRKALVLYESIYDDFAPITSEGIRDTEQFVSHAQDMVRAVHSNTRSVLRRGHALRHVTSDFADAVAICSNVLSTLAHPTDALPSSYVEAFSRFASAHSTSSSDSSPLIEFLATIASVQDTTTAILDSLGRPTRLIYALASTNRNLSRARSSLLSSSTPRKFNLNLPVLEESRQKNVRELENRIIELDDQSLRLAKEIAWNKDVVVGELAGWTSWREKIGKEAVRTFVKSTLIREKERARRLERCLRTIRDGE